MPRPKSDLDSLAVPKSAGPEETPAREAEGQERKAYAHTLSLRLSAEAYRRLRRFVVDQEERTGKRVTHQAVIEAALEDFLSKRA